MLCQSCEKRQATTHIKTILNGELKEFNLCPECAAKLGYGSLISFSEALWRVSVQQKLQNAASSAEAALRISQNRERSDVHNAMMSFTMSCCPLYKEYTEEQVMRESLHVRQVPRLKSKMKC